MLLSRKLSTGLNWTTNLHFLSPSWDQMAITVSRKCGLVSLWDLKNINDDSKKFFKGSKLAYLACYLRLWHFAIKAISLLRAPCYQQFHCSKVTHYLTVDVWKVKLCAKFIARCGWCLIDGTVGSLFSRFLIFGDRIAVKTAVKSWFKKSSLTLVKHVC